MMSDKTITRFNAKFAINTATECWDWTASIASTGYGQFNLGGKITRAHRVSYMLHKGPITDGLWVLHKCDVRSCVNPDHLFLGTHHDNDMDREAKGRGRNGGNLHITIGEKHGQHKLTEPEVKAIRQAYIPGFNSASRGNSLALAKEYGVSRTQILRIVTKQAWKHLK